MQIPMQRVRVILQLALIAALLTAVPWALTPLGQSGQTQIVPPSSWWPTSVWGMSFLIHLSVIGILLNRSRPTNSTTSDASTRLALGNANDPTLDHHAGGVVILNSEGMTMMVNDKFLEFTQLTRAQLSGKKLEVVPFRNCGTETEWSFNPQERQGCNGAYVELALGHGPGRTFVVNSSPITGCLDDAAAVLVTFHDIEIFDTQKQSLMLAMAELQKSKEQIQQQNIRLQELAAKDSLTGCANRRTLMEQLESCWLEYLRSGRSVNLVMLDVDHFKKLNDNFGHAIGDEVLADVARVIRESVGQLGLVGRYGGEEFSLLLPDMPAELAIEIAEGVRRAIQHHLADPFRVTVSLGISSTHQGVTCCQALLEQADNALFAAKQGGRNQVKLWTSGLQDPTDRVATHQQPGAALAEVQHSVSYQAVTALHSALAYRDADTALHSQRVSELCVTLGRGQMSISDLYLLEIAGLLHDIGKIGVPDQVLLKPGRLDQQQWVVMEAHARMGVEIVDSTFQCPELTDVVRYHHYRFDGQGTPEGQPVGKEIPLGARIVSIVDAYDAMVSNRVYRKGRMPEEAFRELRRCAGTQFDPDLVERFVALGIGWRPDSRYLYEDVEYSLAISVGHLTERTVLAFEARDVRTLAESLDRLKGVAKQLDNKAIVSLAEELGKCIAIRDVDWELVMPTLQDLLDMCLAIQRAHIRQVAARPQEVLNCPQKDYYKQARDWEAEAIQGGSGN
jgi:diguanylate cyclase (GGDEF)-like protein